ncbi:porin [Vibrio sp.]|uniref:porin n=1 Tax=Vibrio sp. TaxID=678 RepID=UPI003D11C98E
MKKAALYSAVLAALMSGSTLAATVYKADGTELKLGGRAEFRGDFNAAEDGQEIDGTMKNKSRVRVNVGGNTQITDALSGFAFYEAEQSVKSSGDNDANTSFKQRYMYAGLAGDFGAFSMGKQDTANVQLSQMTDIATFTGKQKEFINAGDEQINNNFFYAYNMDALSLQANYIAGEEKDTDGYGVSGIYTLPFGLGLGLGYAANDNGVGNGSANQFTAGANYELDALYLAATYTMGDIDDKANTEFNGLEVAAQYKLTSAFRLIAAYSKQEVENKNSNTKADIHDFFELTGRYDFNKSIRGYLSYKLNQMKAEDTGYGKDADDTIRLGLRYDF